MSEPIWSTGGAGGERAVTEDLEWAAGALRAAADDVALATIELARRRAALALSPDPGLAGMGSELGHAVSVIGTVLEEQLDDTARRLTAVAAAYLDAERAARHSVGNLSHVREALEDTIGTDIWLIRALASVGLTVPIILDLPGARAVPPEWVPPTTASLNRESVEDALDSSGYLPFVKAIDALTNAGLVRFLTRWGGEVTPQRVQAEPATSVEGVMRELRANELMGGGAVRIDRWTDEYGVTHRVVYVPGTQDWLNSTTNPSDIHADLMLMAGQLPDAAAAVAAALAADGAKPGEPIMLAGHSLGGIVVTALAADVEALAGLDVRAVVTAGSPTGRFELPETVNALHLEGTRDIVPGLDGTANPDTPSRVTVHHDIRDSELGELSGAGHTIPSSHHLDSYRQTAKLVDAGLNASTDAWLGEEREFFEPSDNLVTTVYRP